MSDNYSSESNGRIVWRWTWTGSAVKQYASGMQGRAAFLGRGNLDRRQLAF